MSIEKKHIDILTLLEIYQRIEIEGLPKDLQKVYGFPAERIIHSTYCKRKEITESWSCSLRYSVLKFLNSDILPCYYALSENYKNLKKKYQNKNFKENAQKTLGLVSRLIDSIEAGRYIAKKTINGDKLFNLTINNKILFDSRVIARNLAKMVEWDEYHRLKKEGVIRALDDIYLLNRFINNATLNGDFERANKLKETIKSKMSFIERNTPLSDSEKELEKYLGIIDQNQKNY